MAQTPYTDLTDLKAYLKIDSGDSTNDTFLTNIISQVQSFIDHYTHRTFGWGDVNANKILLDSPDIDYSNSDNIGITSLTASGKILTLNTMGPVPWVVGNNVSLYYVPTQYVGVWPVTAVLSPISIQVDTTVQTGTLGLSYTQAVTQQSAPNFAGYVGNHVTNYKYKTTSQFDGLAGHTIYLRDSDIRSIDTLYIGLRNVAQPVLLDHTQYVWRDDGRIILGGAYFNTYNTADYTDQGDSNFYGTVAAGFQTIMVSYWYGHVGVPSDLSLAALDICSAMYNLRTAAGLQEERTGDYLIRYDINIRAMLQRHPDLLGILEHYRRRHIS